MRRAFSRARRHSRFVRVVRVTIPVLIALILGSVAFVTWFDPLRILVKLPGDAGRLIISGTKIKMEAPKISGYTRDQRWYELSANSAAQDLTKPDVVELQEIRAKIDAEDKSTITLRAADGLFDRKSGILTLNRRIVLTSSGGVEVRLEDAVVDTGTGDIASSKPVEVLMLQGTLNANRLDVVKGGEIVRFSGGVVMDLPANSTNPSGSATGR